MIKRGIAPLGLLLAFLVTCVGMAAAQSRTTESPTLQIYWEGTAAATSCPNKACTIIVKDFTKQIGQAATAVQSQDPVKILASIEGGNAPDLVVLGYVRPSWLQQGAVMPLDSYIKSSHVDLGKFTDAAWNQGYLNGHYYAMTAEQDSVVLLYNKDEFVKAGLDPNKPPQTIAQLDAYAKKLTIRNSDGSIKQLGLLPNGGIYGGGANFYQLWGQVFGGGWYNAATKKVTAEDPHNVQALTWLSRFWKTYGPSKLDRFQAGFGTYLTANDPFYRGKVAMLIDGDWWPFGYLPKRFHLGGSYLPYPDGHPELAHTSGVFGDVMLIPKGSKHPDLAWKFINWYMNNQAEQLNLPNTITGYPLLKSALSKKLSGTFGADPNVQLFEHILLTVHGSPNPLVMPITEKYLQNLNADGDKAVHGQETPLQALQHVDQVSQQALSQALSGQ